MEGLHAVGGVTPFEKINIINVIILYVMYYHVSRFAYELLSITFESIW